MKPQPKTPDVFIADRMLQGFPDDQTRYVE